MFDDSTLETFLDGTMPRFEEQLVEVIEIPSISQQPGTYGKDCRRVAEVVAEYTRDLGFTTDVLETEGLPAVIGKLEVDPSLPWVVIYNHLDVQPANEELQDGSSAWRTEPFVAARVGDAVVGRGATDDKGPLLTTLHAIKYLQETGQLNVNVQVVYETEEEAGSPNFRSFLQENRDHLVEPAAIVVSDTIFEGDNPALTYTLRGVVKAEISLEYTAATQNPSARAITCEAKLEVGTDVVHSGLGGGFVANPNNVLASALRNATSHKDLCVLGYDGGLQGTKIPPWARANLLLELQGRDRATALRALQDQLQETHPSIQVCSTEAPLNELTEALASCRDPQTGDVLVPHFYDGVQEPSAAQLAGIEPIATAATVDRYLKDMGVHREGTYTLDPAQMLTNIWFKPTFDVHNIRRDGTKATAEVSMRLVPGQDPTDLLAHLATHLQEQYEGIVVTPGPGANAVFTAPVDSPYMLAAASACEYGFGLPAVFVGCGGTIGALSPMQESFPGVDMVMLAQSKMSDGYHKANEQFELPHARMGIKAMARCLYNMGEVAKR
jgi:acetylornithine deacetylase/succinyl-diaminopimelate desuccinylase-like protein